MFDLKFRLQSAAVSVSVLKCKIWGSLARFSSKKMGKCIIEADARNGKLQEMYDKEFCDS